jgi:serine protease
MPSNAMDNQISNEAIQAAGHFGNTTATSRRSVEYVVLFTPGSYPGGFNTPNAGWCAWHDWNGDTTLVGGAPRPSTASTPSRTCRTCWTWVRAAAGTT